jgi:hypothetical protein
MSSERIAALCPDCGQAVTARLKFEACSPGCVEVDAEGSTHVHVVVDPGSSAHGCVGAIHVAPRSNDVAHAMSDECPCNPTTEPIPQDDGSMAWVVTHHERHEDHRRAGGDGAL